MVIMQKESLNSSTVFQTPQFRLASPERSNGEAALEVMVADNEEDIVAAQRLRFSIFSEEYGANMGNSGIDRDVFDKYCDHLIVRDTVTGEIVGTYRILTPQKAREIGCWYSESEFFVNRLDALRPNTVEVGRSCVHRDYRKGAAIMMLWSGLAEYMKQGGYMNLVGCASVSMSDGGHSAASLYEKLKGENLAEPTMQVFPKHRLPIEHLNSQLEVDAPPLIKGYLRIGAKICGEPAWDPDFNTADFLMVLSLAKMSPRYAKHFGFKTDH